MVRLLHRLGFHLGFAEVGSLRHVSNRSCIHHTLCLRFFGESGRREILTPAPHTTKHTDPY